MEGSYISKAWGCYAWALPLPHSRSNRLAMEDFGAVGPVDAGGLRLACKFAEDETTSRPRPDRSKQGEIHRTSGEMRM